MKTKNQLSWIILSILILSSQLVIASTTKIINNTNYYLWLADVERIEMPGQGTGPGGTVTTQRHTFGPIDPGKQITDQSDKWQVGVNNISMKAQLKFGTKNSNSASDYAFDLSYDDSSIPISVNIEGKEVKMELKVTPEDATFVYRNHERPNLNWTIIVTQK